MKKTILFCAALLLAFAGYGQYLKPKSELVLNDRMYEMYSQTEIEKMYHNDFERLFRLNFKMTCFARVEGKSVENGQTLGFIEEYANEGVVVDEDRIVREWSLNPYDYSFPQDEDLTNVFRLHTPGYYVVVPSKREYAEMEQANLRQFEY
mgnify:CR=1 FL=1